MVSKDTRESIKRAIASVQFIDSFIYSSPIRCSLLLESPSSSSTTSFSTLAAFTHHLRPRIDRRRPRVRPPSQRHRTWRLSRPATPLQLSFQDENRLQLKRTIFWMLLLTSSSLKMKSPSPSSSESGFISATSQNALKRLDIELESSGTKRTFCRLDLGVAVITS